MTENVAPNLLKRLAPAGVSVVERFGPKPDVDHRYAVNVAHAVPKRQKDHMSGRACAHEALAQLGRATEHIGILPSGAPDWPDGVRGAITHCDGYVACAVATTQAVTWLGIDAEPAEPMRDDAAQLIAFGKEIEWLGQGPLNGRILFCAKEAVFKAWHPVRQSPLDFADATVICDPTTQRFTAAIQRGPALTLNGRWSIENGIIGTLIAQA